MASLWKKIAKMQKEKLLRVVRGSTKQLARNIIGRTPIDTRDFIENWNTSINMPDRTIGRTNLGVNPIVNSIKLGQSLYFVNPRPYNIALEYGSSWRQAPQGMVRVSVADWQGIVLRETKKIK